VHLTLPIESALNHLLAQEPWTRAVLRPHVGQSVRVQLPVLTVRVHISAENTLSVALEAQDNNISMPDVTLILSTEALAAWMQGGQTAVLKHLHIQGDAELANAVSRLAQQLRWDAEEDLARLIGDIAAVRFFKTIKTVHAEAQRTGRATLENIVDYLADERGLLKRPAHITAFSHEVARLRDDVARLEKRIQKILAMSATTPSTLAQGK
jgi:ubiquinone biosynthesis accessory factor UbiJ